MGTPSLWYRFREWLSQIIFPEIWKNYEQVIQQKWELEDALLEASHE